MFISMDNYLKLLENLTEGNLRSFFVGLLFQLAIMVIFCMVMCFAMAKGTKLSLGYTFLGLLGMTGVLMMFCRGIAAKSGASRHCMWLGLLGVMGVILTVVITVHRSVHGYTNNTKNNDTTGTYENYDSDGQETHGYNLNGEYYSNNKGRICLNCGAAVAAGEKACKRCGSRI